MSENQEIVSNWLRAGTVAAGVDLALDAEGHCRMSVGDDETCILEVPEGSDYVYFYLPVLRLPDDAPSEVQALRVALELNSFGFDVRGLSFSYDPRSSYLLLTRAVRFGTLDQDSFVFTLREFIRRSLQVKGTFDDEMGSRASACSPTVLESIALWNGSR